MGTSRVHQGLQVRQGIVKEASGRRQECRRGVSGKCQGVYAHFGWGSGGSQGKVRKLIQHKKQVPFPQL